MSEAFKRRYRAAQSKHNAAKRRNRFKKRSEWSKYAPGGVVKYPRRKEGDEGQGHAEREAPGDESQDETGPEDRGSR